MEFKTFSDFYPFYLREHSNVMCRKLHFLGTCGVIALLLLFFFTGNLMLLILLPLVGYAFAWVGHFVFEKNRPASAALRGARLAATCLASRAGIGGSCFGGRYRFHREFIVWRDGQR